MATSADAAFLVDRDDYEPVAAMLGRAFVKDPLLVHFLGPAAGDPVATATFIRLTMDHVFSPHGETWATPGFQSASIWAAPGHWAPTDAAVEALTGPMLDLIGFDHISVTVRAMDATAEAHPTEEHWYFAYLGTEPGVQGQGLGSAAMRPVLARCDELGLPSYLESSRIENVPLYERHGFTVVRVLQLPDDGPELYTMRREPQR